MPGNFSRVLGIARCRANWVGRSNLFEVNASGILPCANYRAALKPRAGGAALDWDLVFHVEETCEKRLQPFDLRVTMIGDRSPRTQAVSVRDAQGTHDVIVTGDAPEVGLAALFTAPVDYVVHALVPPSDPPRNCVIAPAEAQMPAIYYPAFGPGSKSDCEAFVADRCGEITEDMIAKLRGGEIPWPL